MSLNDANQGLEAVVALKKKVDELCCLQKWENVFVEVWTELGHKTYLTNNVV